MTCNPFPGECDLIGDDVDDSDVCSSAVLVPDLTDANDGWIPCERPPGHPPDHHAARLPGVDVYDDDGDPIDPVLIVWSVRDG